MAETKPKKVRCTCRRCSKRKMEPATIDRAVPYLCAACNDAFIFWENSERAPKDLCLEADAEKYVAAFLRARPHRE